MTDQTPPIITDTTIRRGDRVRSFDFDCRDINGERACYIEGTVSTISIEAGCARYVIVVERAVFGGKEVPFDRPKAVYPPVNGTLKMFGGVTNHVQRIED